MHFPRFLAFPKEKYGTVCRYGTGRIIRVTFRCVNMLRIFPKEIGRILEQGFIWKALYYTLLSDNDVPTATFTEILDVSFMHDS